MRPCCGGPNSTGVIMGMLLFHYAITSQFYQLAVNFFGENIFCSKELITPRSFSLEIFSVFAIVGTSAYLLNSIGRTGHLLYLTSHLSIVFYRKIKCFIDTKVTGLETVHI
jgi:hypothetical protein